MRKVFFTIILVCAIVFNGYAQKGDKAIGLNLGYGSEIKNFAIGAKFNYNISDPIQLAPSFNYFLKKNGLSMWEVNADVHYLFSLSEKVKVYPLAGLGIVHAKVSMGDFYDGFLDLDASTTKLAVNLGGGVGYDIADNITIGAELKYSIISNFDQFVALVSVAYKW